MLVKTVNIHKDISKGRGRGSQKKNKGWSVRTGDTWHPVAKVTALKRQPIKMLRVDRTGLRKVPSCLVSVHLFTSFTIYSSSSKMAMGSGPSPVITSKLPGQPENTGLDRCAFNKTLASFILAIIRGFLGGCFAKTLCSQKGHFFRCVKPAQVCDRIVFPFLPIWNKTHRSIWKMCRICLFFFWFFFLTSVIVFLFFLVNLVESIFVSFWRSGKTMKHSSLMETSDIPLRAFPVFAASMCSAIAFAPNMAARSSVVGGGIGYLPMAISTKDKPRDQMSLCTV